MSERECDTPSKYLHQYIKNHPSMLSGLCDQKDSNPRSPRLIESDREASILSTNSSPLIATCCYDGLEFQVRCRCSIRVHQHFKVAADSSSAGRVATLNFTSKQHRLCGWEQRPTPQTLDSNHVIFSSQNSDQNCLGSGKNTHRYPRMRLSARLSGACLKPKSGLICQSANDRTEFRSSISSNTRSSSNSRRVLYEFEHLNNGEEISLYIDKYRKSITYPKMGHRSMTPLVDGMGSQNGTGELSVSSGKSVLSSAIKPTLLALDPEAASSSSAYMRLFTWRKVL